MRLMILTRGHRMRARLFLRLAGRLTGQRVDEVAQMALYRPRFFGGPMFALGGDILRGPSFWTPAEREFLAVFVSRLNECQFCVRIHTEAARIESRDTIEVADASSVRSQVAAVLPLLEKATRTPALVGSQDIDAARAAGVPDTATADAMYILMLFNLMNRLANAFDLAWDSDVHVRVGAKVIHRMSYRLPRFLVR